MTRALLLLAALAAPVAAQTPAAPPGARQVRIDVSPAGQAVLKKYLAGPDPVVKQRVEQLRTIGGQMAALANAPRLDLVRLQALLTQQEDAKTALQRHADERTMAMLRELSEADRLKFMRSLRAGPSPAAR